MITCYLHTLISIINSASRSCRNFSCNGKRYSHRVYTPDFVIYQDYKIVKVVDIKGGSATDTTATRLRMIMFMRKYDMPVTIARYDYKTGLFVEKQA